MKMGFKTRARAFFLATIVWGSITLPALAETVLYKGNGGEPQTLHPAHTSINIEAFVVADLYEGLTIHDAYGKVIPGTAESWTISPDGTVYTASRAGPIAVCFHHATLPRGTTV